MNKYDICTNYAEIIAGTNNTISSAYLEATKSIEENGTKGMAYLKNFITSIENIAGKENVKDERISKSKGNIKDFQGYENIKSAMEFLKKTLSGVSIIGDLVSIYNALEDCQPEYTDAYNKNVRLGILEYESAVYLLVTGLSMTMATKIDVVQNGYQIKIQKKSGSTFGVIEKTIQDLAKQLSSKNHKGYLEDLIASKDHVGVDTEIKESTFMESAISDTLELIDTVWSNAKQIGSFVKRTFSAIKNSLFGIIPLIRSILYLRYKKKADTIIALEEQIEFIERNIEQLNNIKGMDESKKKEIIQKQKAVVEAYRKKAEKLRAELTEGEKDASIAIKKEDPEMKKVDDGDFILEGVNFASLFTEATAESIARRRKNEEENKIKEKNPKSSSFGSSKVPNNITTNNVETKKLDMKLLDEVIAEFHKETAKKTIRLELEEDKVKDITSSKLGGQPYWPKGMDYPITTQGDNMVLLAQLNFAELPNIPNYPTSGILQFFVDIEVGECITNNHDSIKVIYHENISDDIDTTERKTIDSDDYSPFTGEYAIKSSVVKDMYPCDIFGDELNDIFMPIFNKYFDTNIKAVSHIDDEFDDKSTWDIIYDKLVKSVESWGTRIGGYPNFTQYDPRTSDKYDALLLQIDSEKGIMWGDCGIANVFINSDKLKKKDFSDVFFTWDCY